MSEFSTESIILSNLCKNSEYASKVLAYLEPEYFKESIDKEAFNIIRNYIVDYNTVPSKPILARDLVEKTNLLSHKKTRDDIVNFVKHIFSIETNSDEWLLKETESFCRERAIHNAIVKSISIYDGTDSSSTVNAIPDILKNAIGISFDSSIGHDYFNSTDLRYDYYTTTENKIEFDIGILNKVTEGGCPRKTLNIILAPINSGKTMTMIHLASAYFKAGYNVLYFTMEMSEVEIMKRVDANVLKIPLSELQNLRKDDFLTNVEKLRAKSVGKLKVKEFPTSSAHTGHLRHVIDEYKLKENFIPDIIFVDYLGITASAKYKPGSQNSYTILKSVAEELRALAQETNSVLWTAMQIQRGAMESTDIEMSEISDSVGIPAVADFMLALIRTEELDSMGQLMIKQLKSRYSNKSKLMRFIVGVDLEQQRLFDVDIAISDKLVTMQREQSPESPKPAWMNKSTSKSGGLKV